MNRPPNPQRRARKALLEKELLWARGFNRGAANHWRARNNRKLSRIAART